MGDDCAREFVAGFVTGVIVAGLVGFITFRIRWHWGRIKATGKPQTIRSDTDKTSCQVLIDGCKSLLLVPILIFVVILCLVAIVLLVAAYFFGLEEVIAFVVSLAQFMIRQFI